MKKYLSALLLLFLSSCNFFVDIYNYYDTYIIENKINSDLEIYFYTENIEVIKENFRREDLQTYYLLPASSNTIISRVLASEGEGTAYSINFAVFDSIVFIFKEKPYMFFMHNDTIKYENFQGLMERSGRNNEETKTLPLTEKIIKERDSLYRYGK